MIHENIYFAPDGNRPAFLLFSIAEEICWKRTNSVVFFRKYALKFFMYLGIIN